MRKRVNIVGFLMQVLLTLCFAELVFPPLTVMTSEYFTCLLCIVGWFCLSVIKNRAFYLRCPLYVLLSLVYFVLVVAIPYLFGFPVIGNRYSAISLIPLGYVIYKFHQKDGSLHIIKGAIIVAIILSAITAMTTIAALINNASVSRSIKGSGEYSETLKAQGIGGYWFIYYAAIMASIFLECMIYNHGKKKVIYGALCALFAFLTFKSNYTIALVMMVLSFALLIAYYIFRKSRYRAIYALFFAFVICALYIAGDILWGTVVAVLPERVAEIFTMNSGNTALEQLADEFLLGRWPTMQTSIDAFLRAPLFGIVVSGEIGTAGIYLQGFGQHSHILDTFALYGIGIGIMTIYFLFLPFRKKDRTEDTGFMLAILTSAVVVYFFNNATNSVAFAIGIVYPYVRDTIRKTE